MVMGKLRLESVFHLLWSTNEEAMKRCRRDLESQGDMSRYERLVICGDFIVNVMNAMLRIILG